MKKLAKLFSIVALVAMLVASLCFMTACDDNDGDETPWDGRTYTINVQLPDGSGVEGVRLAVCYNTSQTASVCMLPVSTNTNGQATIEIPEGTEYIGNPVLHFVEKITGGYYIPSGYNMPSSVGEVVMNHPAGENAEGYTYEHAIELTEATTTITLVAA